jgi:GH15 family glucan-1,4-alpha-glucosidase
LASRIEDYAMIGDCKTAALVALNGCIDWLCLPRFDSPSCFCSLLGTEEHGIWSIAPTAEIRKTSRHYLDGSLILHTEFETDAGKVQLTDFMPIKKEGSDVVRLVRGLEGTVTMRFNLVVRFGYGNTVPWADKLDQRTLVLIAGPDKLVLRSSVDLQGDDRHTAKDFTVVKGECLSFVLSYGLSHLEHPPVLDVDEAYKRTKTFWTGWSDRCSDAGRWSDGVKRSLITLKGLSYMPTGGIVAAPTTSLPEQIGGARNWDYRYCWLRDSAFTLLAFLNAGYNEEAHSFRDWILRAVAGSPDQIQIMYGIGGERQLDERELPWLPGYEGSTPVRIGNAATSQSQLDIFGELCDALILATKSGLDPVEHSPQLRSVILEHLEQIWAEPDNGIWEVRGAARHFTLSKVMAWVAFDRASSDPLTTDKVDRDHYRSVADEIHASICRNAVDPKRNCFTQAYGVKHMDASLLLIALVGFLPPEDERIQNTVAEIERRLLIDGLVLRYETESGIDGLPSGEGAFLACSFWLVDNLILQGRVADAEALFDRLVGLCNDVGLLAEEYDPVAKRQLGNFPQAFSHVAMVNSAFGLARAKDHAARDNDPASQGKSALRQTS